MHSSATLEKLTLISWSLMPSGSTIRLVIVFLMVGFSYNFKGILDAHLLPLADMYAVNGNFGRTMICEKDKCSQQENYELVLVRGELNGS